MPILITGASGFVGRHLANHLLQTNPDLDIHGTTLPDMPYKEQPGVTFHGVDLKNAAKVDELISNVRPSAIYHLAAQAFVPRSFEEPWETLENNILSQLNVIQACLKKNVAPRMLVISSSDIYGPVTPQELPITENAQLKPTNPYSVSKIAQDMMAFQYYLSHKLPIMRARSFNHFGPGQNENFVAPAFAMQIARIETGLQQPEIKVGDLSAKRDFTDVRDIVRAYRFIVEKGQPGDVYNVCSGEVYSAQQLLDTFLGSCDISIEVTVDPQRLRPVTIPIVQGDNSRLNAATGWQPQISFEQTLADVLEDCRHRVRSDASK